jgi:anti-sigma regulatory factor (Ser/Thr protein kinase)
MMNSTKSRATRFEQVTDADSGCVAGTREELGHWLQHQFDLSSTRLNDVILAGYEALVNAVEFAYLDAGAPGPVTVRAVHDPGRSALTLTVADRGHWRAFDPSSASRFRWRGIPLMAGLADQASIDTSTQGTTVRLVFNDVRLAADFIGAEVPCR